MPEPTRLTWRMWHGSETLELTWPEGWQVQVRAMADAPGLHDAAVARAVARPCGGPTLEELARGRGSCCILVDDLTRPTPTGRILPPMLDALERGGLRPADITIIVATGAHRALSPDDLAKKLGPGVRDGYRVLNHDCHGDLTAVAEVDGIGPIEVNRRFCEAGLKIGVTGVMPHFMSGFSGGAKIVMPAVCGLATIAATHARTLGGLPAAVGVVEGNRMRAVMDEGARAAGLEFTADCVFSSRGEPCGLFCGRVTESFAAAVAMARRVYATDVPYGSDVGVFNAFPKDTEFIQAMASLNVWADRADPARCPVRPGGTIVVICAASEGLGGHELIECGRPHFKRRDRHGSFREVLGGRELLFLAPGIEERTVHTYYQPEARHFRDWPALRACLHELHPDGARVSVFPASALQTDAAFVEEKLRERGQREA